MVSSTIYAQPVIKGIVVEKGTKLPVPFAAVIYQSNSMQMGVIADVNGRFEIAGANVSTLNVSCVGYQSCQVAVAEHTVKGRVIVELESRVHEIGAVVVTPKDNPAIPIIKRVLRNKDVNNFQKYEQYRYRCYFKTIIDIKLSVDATSQDSAQIRANDLIKKQAGFISECIVVCSQANGRADSKIIAHKTSGFENPMFVQTFVSMFHNSISFYNNSIPLFLLPFSDDKSVTEYVSPLSDGCLSVYNFHLQEVYADGADSVFVINFYPKKGRNFNSLTGTLFITSNGYALKNVVVEPFEQGLIGFRFRQDYSLVNGRWFPAKLDEEIGWVKQKVSSKVNAYPVYIITSVIDSVEFSSEINVRDIGLENVYIDERSAKSSDSIINAVRKDSLTKREVNTYHTLDSIGQKHRFDYWAKFMPKLLFEGKIPYYCFDIDLSKIFMNNKYEGTRLGFGLLTNERISKHFELAGYAGYGFKDEVWKYGGRALVHLDKYNEVQLEYSYRNDLREAGSSVENSIWRPTSNEYLRKFLGYRFDACEEHRAEFSFRAFRFFKFSALFSSNELEVLYPYTYKGSELTNYRADEFQASVRFAYREGLSTFGPLRYVSAEGNPVISLTYQRGTDLFNSRSFNYNRYEASISLTAYSGRIGQSNIKVDAGYIDRSLPYGMLFTGEGSWNDDFSLLINNSFQTMQPYEFLSDRYASLFYSHNFGTLLFKTKKFKPQFIVVQNSGWGNIGNALDHGIEFATKDKVYLESGLVINNIVKFNYVNMFYIGFGVGGFYRYGHYAHSDQSDNYTLKMTVSVTLK
ncbi:MAG: carboxypeptidase-like regulatory domain-containing protein [Bacteroidales bacterium]|nr:carboxypeptidase-like regulatory domain-containing protein [Bacteroidales bacterium]